MDQNNLANKRAIVIGCVLIAFLLIYGIGGQINKSLKVKTEIQLAPSTAELTIDGKPSGPGTVYLSKGNHEISAKLKGFGDSTQKVEAKKSDEPLKVNVLLSPNTTAGREYLDDNPDLQLEREKVGGESYFEGSSQLSQRYPFLSDLPLERQRFTVNSGDPVNTVRKDNGPYIALHVDAVDPSEKWNALRSISEDLNVDLSKVEIVFENYYNPFQKVILSE